MHPFLAANGFENARDGIRLRGRFGQKTPGSNPVAGKNVILGFHLYGLNGKSHSRRFRETPR
jgi:hypothetical protein